MHQLDLFARTLRQFHLIAHIDQGTMRKISPNDATSMFGKGPNSRMSARAAIAGAAQLHSRDK
jgi:hypothetical protein